jgi:hypothetical protein
MINFGLDGVITALAFLRTHIGRCNIHLAQGDGAKELDPQYKEVVNSQSLVPPLTPLVLWLFGVIRVRWAILRFPYPE